MLALDVPQPVTTVPHGYASVSSAVLRRLHRWDIDLYAPSPTGGSPLLLREASVEVSDELSERITETDDREFLVRNEDFESLSYELLTCVDDVITDESVEASERYSLLQYAAASEVEHACRLVQPDRFVELTAAIGPKITLFIESSDLAPTELYRIARHDYHTFTHVTNVATYAALLARELGYTDSETLQEIATGALLHDIGKRHVPNAILRKPSRPTEEEWRVIRSHPQLGYEDVVGREDVSPAQLMMIYQHHEWINGGGYPVGVVGDEIHEWAQLLAVVDVFDAMTGQRPYRRPASAADVAKHLCEKAGTHFNPEMVRCWISMLGA